MRILILLHFIGICASSLQRSTHIAVPIFRIREKIPSSFSLSSLSEDGGGGREQHDLEALSNRLVQLKLEKERRRLELLANEVAIQKTVTEIAKWDSLDNSSNQAYRRSRSSYDYGFISKSAGSGLPGKESIAGNTVPASAIRLASDSFLRNLADLVDFFGQKVQPKQPDGNITDEALLKLSQLKLSNDAIWDRERARPPITAPLIIKGPYLILCFFLDALFDNRPISRFYFLETVARMPYFSYITMLHTYETLGWWRRSAEVKRIHFAEEYNEYHHLLIWESLGGDQEWAVRFFAQHSAIVYFYVLIILWIFSPTLAYNFSELIEAHAVDTYAEFAESNKEILQSMDAPPIAKEYYEAADMYVFDEFQTGRSPISAEKIIRRPVITSLYDVVCNIRDDEQEHVNTMAQCQDPQVLVQSPNTEAAIFSATLAAGIAAALWSSGVASTGEGDVLELRQILDSFGSAFSSTTDSGEDVGAALSSVAAVGSSVSDKTGEGGTVAAEGVSILLRKLLLKVFEQLSKL